MSSSHAERYLLNLKNKTWVRDSHGLFDYESPQTRCLNAFLADSVVITRKRHDIKTQNSQIIPADEEFLLNVSLQNNTYILSNNVETGMQPTETNINNLSNKIWYVLRHAGENTNVAAPSEQNPNEDYYLCKNDIIKLGRVKYALNEIHFTKEVTPPMHVEDPKGYNINTVNVNSEPVFDFIFKAKSVDDMNTQEDNTCKICYTNTDDNDNPLVHLCNCSGGICFAHYLCIKRWMETKLIKKANDKKTVNSYNIKSFNCEICKTPYPFRFKLNRRAEPFDLIDIEKPQDQNYIVLESLNQMKENCNIKSIHVITLTNDPISIGRGHDSDVRINDISVSRNHATLTAKLETGQLLLRDGKSKFGTLVLLKKPIEVKEKKIQLQVGRTLIMAGIITYKEFEDTKKSKEHHNQQQNAKKQEANDGMGNLGHTMAPNINNPESNDKMELD